MKHRPAGRQGRRHHLRAAGTLGAPGPGPLLGHLPSEPPAPASADLRRAAGLLTRMSSYLEKAEPLAPSSASSAPRADGGRAETGRRERVLQAGVRLRRTGSGTTSLAVPLAAELGYALLAKDRIKETLHGVKATKMERPH
jgi:hypothetical protein